MPAPLRFCGRTCETFVLMVTVHCSWWTGVLKLRDALLSSVYKQLGSVIWPSLGSFLFHGVPWECARSKFWIQGVELAVLMLFQRCFYCDWIVIGCGQGFTWEKSPCPQYFFYLMLSDFFFYDIFSYMWRNGWWHMTLLFGTFAYFVIISHVNTNLKVILTVVWLVVLLNRKVNVYF